MTLDLHNEKAREIFYDLVKISDVVWDNFRPGTLERFKIDYEDLSKVNSRIISCSVTGFGLDSPFRDRPALDLLIQGMGGVMSFTGEAGRPPVRVGYPMGDLGGGVICSHVCSRSPLLSRSDWKGAKVRYRLARCPNLLVTYSLNTICWKRLFRSRWVRAMFLPFRFEPSRRRMGST